MQQPTHHISHHSHTDGRLGSDTHNHISALTEQRSTIKTTRRVTFIATFRISVLMLMSNSARIWHFDNSDVESRMFNLGCWFTSGSFYGLQSTATRTAANKSPCHDVCHVYTFVTHDCRSKILRLYSMLITTSEYIMSLGLDVCVGWQSSWGATQRIFMQIGKLSTQKKKISFDRN